MPMREQSRIKADTVAEECTCEECPAPAPEPSGNSFRPTWGERFIAQDPAPEPSGPPTGVPVCHRDCGKTYGGTGEAQWASSSPVYATRECAEAERCLSSPPGSAHSAPFAHDCDIVPDDEIPTAEEGAETCRRLGIDVPAWADDVRKRVAAVATGGVPAGFRLGAGWVVDRTYLCSCTGCRSNTSTEYYKPRSCGKGACAAHAVLMGALVPIDTARSVPTGPVSVEAWRGVCVCNTGDPVFHAHYSDGKHSCARCSSCDAFAAAAPAAPASEPAVRPLSERLVADLELVCEDDLQEWRVRVSQWGDKVAGLEAELADAKEESKNHELNREINAKELLREMNEHAAALAEAKRREDKAVELTVVTHAGNVKLHADRETLRAELAEHAAALGLATARVRELEGERDELLGMAKTGWSSAHSIAVTYGSPSTEMEARAALAIIARIEKATKGTT